MIPTDRIMIVTRFCGERRPVFTSNPPIGNTETIVAGIITIAKVNGIIQERIQSI